MICVLNAVVDADFQKRKKKIRISQENKRTGTTCSDTTCIWRERHGFNSVTYSPTNGVSASECNENEQTRLVKRGKDTPNGGRKRSS